MHKYFVDITFFLPSLVERYLRAKKLTIKHLEKRDGKISEEGDDGERVKDFFGSSLKLTRKGCCSTIYYKSTLVFYAKWLSMCKCNWDCKKLNKYVRCTL